MRDGHRVYCAVVDSPNRKHARLVSQAKIPVTRRDYHQFVFSNGNIEKSEGGVPSFGGEALQV